ncbi:hypothetical protein HHI36_008870 [Cryptolaemus montrouzieri]|uniref:Uncharacterized protein n=1 Tax=Cryptolaemus montrouzieri TaxID=559131 RepID=A0ABD2MU77_9CUCU
MCKCKKKITNTNAVKCTQCERWFHFSEKGSGTSDSTIVSESDFSCAACDALNTSGDIVVEVEGSQEQQGLLNDLLKESARLINENELYKKLVENMEDKIQLLNF